MYYRGEGLEHLTTCMATGRQRVDTRCVGGGGERETGLFPQMFIGTWSICRAG